MELTEPPSELLRTGEAARALGVSANTLKGWIREGRLEALRLPSGHYRIPAVAVERLLREGRWRAQEAWRRSRPIDPVDVDEVLAWIDEILELAEHGGPSPPPDLEAKVRAVQRTHRALAALGR